MHLRNRDLNLLVALDTLLKEESVTRAAQALHLSQSAMSHALARLREMFGDPILVRGPRGMQPTPRAEQLRDQVARTLRDVESVFANGPFDPATTTHTFYVGTIDYVELTLWLPLVERVRRTAPGVRILVRPITLDKYQEDLTEGRVDMVIGFIRKPPAQAHKRLLFSEDYACVTRAGLLQTGEPLTLDRYLAAGHIQVSPSATFTGVPDLALAKLHLRRNIVMAIPRYFSATDIAAHSDLILTVQSRIARRFADSLPIRIFPPPFALPELKLSMLWLARTHRDPAQQWLRELIADVSRDI
ncbi:LysR family transcriptional regulator [Pigmentiphaga soli]|uniref:LysR family transcriptional regulator n=1 Tax=Pigmentiphaga soli TaxID=1007095 RepID=A0ABP8GLS4_9BURK